MMECYTQLVLYVSLSSSLQSQFSFEGQGTDNRVITEFKDTTKTGLLH